MSEHDRPELGELIAAVKAERGGNFLNLYAALANSPAICAGWLGLFTAIRQKSGLAPQLRELAMLRVAVLNRAEYEFVSHTPFALAAGLSGRQLEGLRLTIVDRSLYLPNQLAVIDYTDQMTQQIQVDQPCFAAVRATCDDKTLLELTVTIAGYNMVSRVLEALIIPHDRY